ncbi:MAG: FAD-dependent oxidoreductase [Burkholderiales bacterium]
MKRLVLVGGGHAHLSVLEALGRDQPGGIEAVLVTPSRFQIYSGMLPGWVAGHYVQRECEIDLLPLAQLGLVRVVKDWVVGLDADRHLIRLNGGEPIEYDLLSLDVGSETDVSDLGGAGEKLLPVKPLDAFFDAWPRIVTAARHERGYRLVIVGGGAAGVEVALAARHAFRRWGVDARVDLVVSEAGLLAGHAASVRRRIARILDSAEVVVHGSHARGTEAGVVLSDGTLLRADCVIAATGARAPGWLKSSGLRLDRNGYIAVDATYRSVSHPNVFAAGDVSARKDVAVARSGVHAVHAGPVLAANLLAALRGGTMRTYQPRRYSLYLLACGPRYAVASWGPWSAAGAWVWHWKNWIDRRFVQHFETAAARASSRRRAG